jgi:hypothetical protein
VALYSKYTRALTVEQSITGPSYTPAPRLLRPKPGSQFIGARGDDVDVGPDDVAWLQRQGQHAQVKGLGFRV